MLLLQASFFDNHLLLWGETPLLSDDKPGKTRGRKKATAQPASLPYDPGAETLSCALAGLFDPSAGPNKIMAALRTALVWLPTAYGLPLPSSPLIASPPPGETPLVLAPWRITVLSLDHEQAIALLCACIGRDVLASGVLIGATLTFWAGALRFAGALVARQQFLPDVQQDEEGYCARWRPVFAGTDTEKPAALARTMPAACRALSESADTPPDTPALEILSGFLHVACDTLVRSSLASASPASKPSIVARKIPSRRAQAANFDSLHDQWLHALRAPDGRMVGKPDALEDFAAQVRAWRRPLSLTTSAPFRLCFRLEEPLLESEDNERDANGDRDAWYVRYLLQSRSDPSLLIPAEEAWNAKGHLAALLAHADFQPREYLLSALGQASLVSQGVEASLQAARPGGYALETRGAQEFLTQTAWMLEQAGFGVYLPAWWTRKGTKLRLSARAHVKAPKMQSKAGLSMETLVDFDWEVALGGEPLTRQELEELARQKGSLVRLRGQWVQLDAREIEAALAFWQQHAGNQKRVRDIVRLALGAEGAPGGLELAGVDATGWVKDLLAQMTDQATLEETPLPEGFAGTLRPYQRRGYDWLNFLSRWGLGACLADDMGLGKTAQTLAFVQKEWETGEKRPILVICPTSVVGNWNREAQRFTPELPVLVHHGLGRTKGETFQTEVEKQALVLSSFALLHRDFEMFKAVSWGGIILDEAQNIKNAETKQSKAARGLQADWRIALTGTPVENHVGDLWAILDFLNPGLLGSQAEFKRLFFVPIQANQDREAADRLKQLTRPFVLRRLKTDKAIIADLPDKMEMKVFCNLTQEQVSLYEAVVKEAEEQLDSTEGIQRKGVVLATLSKLKQVCNHPAQFLGDNSSVEGRSGKLARLTEMLEEVLAVGDKALIFSQFTEMGNLIRRHIQDTFGKEVLFLHGGVPKPQRDRMVERFQNEGQETPLFLLSLKAGGVGLNLTAANHVFHFDRWWNPAVENQATDRAFRIGQTKNVQVHKFVCAGTLEEKIDAMIESKRQVAASVVGTGEEWLTNLSTEELKALFALRPEAA